MKKTLFLAIVSAFICTQSIAQTEFTNALSSCEKYSQDGSIPYQGQVFNLKITLEKGKGGKCTYKEKIYQDNTGYELLTCNFDKDQLKFIANSMNEYSDLFKKELAKNKIFEAKLSSNGVIFQKYLVDKNYCQITHFKKK